MNQETIFKASLTRALVKDCTTSSPHAEVLTKNLFPPALEMIQNAKHLNATTDFIFSRISTTL